MVLQFSSEGNTYKPSHQVRRATAPFLVAMGGCSAQWVRLENGGFLAPQTWGSFLRHQALE